MELTVDDQLKYAKMGRNASIMHTSRTGKQEITDQYLFKEKIAKKNLINKSINVRG